MNVRLPLKQMLLIKLLSSWNDTCLTMLGKYLSIYPHKLVIWVAATIYLSVLTLQSGGRIWRQYIWIFNLVNFIIKVDYFFYNFFVQINKVWLLVFDFVPQQLQVNHIWVCDCSRIDLVFHDFSYSSTHFFVVVLQICIQTFLNFQLSFLLLQL